MYEISGIMVATIHQDNINVNLIIMHKLHVTALFNVKNTSSDFYSEQLLYIKSLLILNNAVTNNFKHSLYMKAETFSLQSSHGCTTDLK